MKKFLSITTAVLSVAACTSGHDGWTLKGDIEGGASKTVYIEGSTIGNWYLIDSVAIGEDDSFDYIAAKADSLPTIYRIRLADKYIYFPAQGTQTLTLKANAKSFDRGFDVAGSPLLKIGAFFKSVFLNLWTLILALVLLAAIVFWIFFTAYTRARRKH